jgi:hypothetical protein
MGMVNKMAPNFGPIESRGDQMDVEISGKQTSVPVDYKSAKKAGPISLKRLKSLIESAEYDILKLSHTVNKLKLEVVAITEEVGESL